MEDRLIDIETRLAHQDQTLNELNDALAKQQETIMKLERLCAAMSSKIASIDEALPAAEGGDEMPPHY